MINGINLNDLSNSQVTFQPSINTVSEFKVDNSTFSAEYGRNSGAIVNVATRSGANAMHGEAIRLLSRRLARLAEPLQPRAEPEIAVQSQAVRRQSRRTDQEEQDVLLLQLRGASPHAGRRPERGRADRRPARGRDRSGREEPAEVHPARQHDRRQRPGAAAGVGHRAGQHRPVHDRRAAQPRRQRRPARLLRLSEGSAQRAERSGQHRAGLRRHARRKTSGA